jgi:gamma-glutamylcyclotransferase (GGCT)/AIG2-like uncharacterized protein YtfP
MKFDLSTPTGINWAALISSVKSLTQNPINPGDPLPTLPDGRFAYFAYGSNLDRERMKVRCPDSECLGFAQCPNATVQFRKYITLIPHITRSVSGLVYALSADDVAALDRYEGYPDHYMRYRITLSDNKSAFAYIMKEGTRPIQPPSLWYFNLIANAALELPDSESYLAELYKAQEAATNACSLPSFLLHGKDLVFAATVDELWEAIFEHRGPFLSHLDAESYLERIHSLLGISPEDAQKLSFEDATASLASAGVLVPIPGKGRPSAALVH